MMPVFIKDALELSDYRRQVSELYTWVRSAAGEPQKVWEGYRNRREALFRNHPLSALDPDQRTRFQGLPYFEYDPALRFVLPVEPALEGEVLEVQLEAEGLTRFERFGRITFEIIGRPANLSLYWILGYGGGVFLPFRDATAGEETYGSGRYLLDTIKGVDLGREGDPWVFDFNYAYNPSCAYNARWHCPLAPHENWLTLPIRGGEKTYPDPA